MKRGLVSVIISAYNAEYTIADSMHSILDQTYDNWELIAINDCSTDKTPQIMEQMSSDNPHIRLIHNKENIGLTQSLNIGLEYAGGEFIARLDADCTSKPLRLERQVGFLNIHTDIELVGTGVYLIDSSGHKVRTINVVSRDYIISRFLKYVNLFNHTSILARRKTIECLGGYRKKFHYSQDYDLVLRLSDKYKLSNIPEYLVYWKINKNSTTLQHLILQRIYADIAREFAFERKQKGYDRYNSINMDEKINDLMTRNYGRYRCERGVYKMVISKQYREGLGEILKGTIRGGFPFNALMRGIVQVIAKM